MTTTTSPQEQLASDISSFRSQLNSLEQSTGLTNIRDAVEDIQTSVNGFAQRIAGLRSRGFVYGKDFETQAAQFAKQWAQMSPNVLTQINQQANRLQTTMTTLVSRSAALNPANMTQARTLLGQLKPQADTLSSQASAAESQLKGMYNSFESQVNHLSAQLNDAEWTLTQVEEATFQLLATEAAVMAVKAVFVRNGKEDKEDPDGVLFLTDQRMIFEQKEEIATKKILFITTETQKVQKVQFEAPVALVEAVSPSKQGLFKNEDNIEVKFGSGAPTDKVRFHIWQDCNQWQALISRVKSKDVDKDRAVAVDASAEARVKAAPSQCPSCGGVINQVILRGQDNIKCEFCGSVIRL